MHYKSHGSGTACVALPIGNPSVVQIRKITQFQWFRVYTPQPCDLTYTCRVYEFVLLCAIVLWHGASHVWCNYSVQWVLNYCYIASKRNFTLTASSNLVCKYGFKVWNILDGENWREKVGGAGQKSCQKKEHRGIVGLSAGGGCFKGSTTACCIKVSVCLLQMTTMRWMQHPLLIALWMRKSSHQISYSSLKTSPARTHSAAGYPNICSSLAFQNPKRLVTSVGRRPFSVLRCIICRNGK